MGIGWSFHFSFFSSLQETRITRSNQLQTRNMQQTSHTTCNKVANAKQLQCIQSEQSMISSIMTISFKMTDVSFQTILDFSLVCF